MRMYTHSHACAYIFHTERDIWYFIGAWGTRERYVCVCECTRELGLYMCLWMWIRNGINKTWPVTKFKQQEWNRNKLLLLLVPLSVVVVFVVATDTTIVADAAMRSTLCGWLWDSHESAHSKTAIKTATMNKLKHFVIIFLGKHTAFHTQIVCRSFILPPKNADLFSCLYVFNPSLQTANPLSGELKTL